MQKYIFYTINILGGISVLFSYAHGLITHVELRDYLWGGITEVIRPLYTINMFLATAGYFFFTSYVINKMFRSKNHQFKKIHFVIINILYAGIIIPSALWMPDISSTYLLIRFTLDWNSYNFTDSWLIFKCSNVILFLFEN